jgi:hypothetical protein
MNRGHLAVSGAFDNPDVLVPILAPAVTFGAIIAVVGIALYFRYRAQQLRQELYASFIQKGEPIPPELLPGKAPKRGNADLRAGLVLLLGGIGLSFALCIANLFPYAGFGSIPALIGVGYLIVWKVEVRGGAQSARS